MEKTSFKKVVEKLILPLFTGSYIGGEEVSSSRDSEVAYGKQNSLLIKPNKLADYRLVLKRGQPFKMLELNLLKSIISEINTISELGIEDENYIRSLQDQAIEKAICLSLSDSDTAVTMQGIITELSKWASRTYEGKKVELGIILNQSVDNGEIADKSQFSKIMNKDFFALLSDGKDSFIEFDKKGNLIGYVQAGKSRQIQTITPYVFENIARYCSEKKIGIVLTENGDILIFRNRSLMFSKRLGVWNVYSHEEVIQLLANRGSYSLKDIRRSIYYTALDVSYGYSGGCLIYLNKDTVESALSHINAHDILDESYYEIKKKQEIANASKLYNLHSLSQVEEMFSVSYSQFLVDQKCYKAQCLKKIIDGKKFHELSRKLRQELVAMDGATVVDLDGTIIAVGAILKIEAGSEGGGRLAAATTLAKYGIAIKISQDGILKAFYYDKKAGKLKSLFTVG